MSTICMYVSRPVFEGRGEVKKRCTEPGRAHMWYLKERT